MQGVQLVQEPPFSELACLQPLDAEPEQADQCVTRDISAAPFNWGLGFDALEPCAEDQIRCVLGGLARSEPRSRPVSLFWGESSGIPPLWV